jgi:hypothetical protein
MRFPEGGSREFELVCGPWPEYGFYRPLDASRRLRSTDDDPGCFCTNPESSFVSTRISSADSVRTAASKSNPGANMRRMMV